MTIRGVDVSHWNGVLDWPELSKEYDFAIIKATQGTWFVDDKFKDNVNGARDNGMNWSLYHFLDPIQDGMQDGNEQYEWFMDKTAGWHGVLPNALDVEWQGNLTKFQLTELVLDFLIVGGDWLLYSNLNFLNNIILQPEDVALFADIWLAWPAPTAMKPRMPLHYDEDEVKIWQYDWTVIDKNKVLDEKWYWKLTQGLFPVRQEVIVSYNAQAVEVVLDGT